jgi:hypothetical protein
MSSAADEVETREVRAINRAAKAASNTIRHFADRIQDKTLEENQAFHYLAVEVERAVTVAWCEVMNEGEEEN